MNSNDIRRFKDDIAFAIKHYPELEVSYIGRRPSSLEGHLSVIDKDLEVRGEFNVRINIPPNYPHGFPTMRELGKIIPREIDRHINADGSCCLTILQKQILEVRRGITIKDFIDQYSIPYLANQIYFEEYGEWANGEYLHGNEGIAQFYLEEIQVSEYTEVLNVLAIVLNYNKIERNQTCYCGSNLKFKKCHLDLIENLSLIGIKQLKHDYEMILAL